MPPQSVETTLHLANRNQESQGQRSSRYGEGPPWIFTGRALYQIHAVKAEVAKKFVPPELKLVQAFGYTLGGMYLAHYESSPAGAFDELVVIAGTVWNPPTSCAWAAKVLVSSLEARNHGRKEVGLPSHHANFLPMVEAPRKQRRWFWNLFPRIRFRQTKQPITIQHNHNHCGFSIEEVDGFSKKPLCHITLPTHWLVSESKKQWQGPPLSLSLPSFSGRTQQQPDLLKYSCQLNCSVKLVEPALVTSINQFLANEGGVDDPNMADRSVFSLLTAKPLLALSFEGMLMRVEAPMVVVPKNERVKDSGKPSPNITWSYSVPANSS